MSECFGSWGCLSVSVWTSSTCPCVTSFVFLGTLKGWNETKLWPGTHPSAGWMIPVRVPDGRAWRGLWIWAQIRVHSRWFDWKDEILNWIQNKEPAAKTRDSLKATKASKSSEYPQLLTLTLIHYTASCCRAAECAEPAAFTDCFLEGRRVRRVPGDHSSPVKLPSFSLGNRAQQNELQQNQTKREKMEDLLRVPEASATLREEEEEVEAISSVRNEEMGSV